MCQPNKLDRMRIFKFSAFGEMYFSRWLMFHLKKSWAVEIKHLWFYKCSSIHKKCIFVSDNETNFIFTQMLESYRSNEFLSSTPEFLISVPVHLLAFSYFPHQYILIRISKLTFLNHLWLYHLNLVSIYKKWNCWQKNVSPSHLFRLIHFIDSHNFINPYVCFVLHVY